MVEKPDKIEMDFDDFESLILSLIGDCYVKVKSKTEIEIWQRYTCYGNIKYKKVKEK